MNVYLDFDGCLHPISQRPYPFLLCELFEDVIRQGPASTTITISSAWRKDHTLAQIKRFFAADIAARITGVTSDLSREKGPYERQREIEIHRLEHGLERQPFVVLDDDRDLFSLAFAERHVIFCDPETGLTDRELLQLYKRLSRGR